MLRILCDAHEKAVESVKRLTEFAIPGYEKLIPEYEARIKALTLKLRNKYQSDSEFSKALKLEKLQKQLRKLRLEVQEEQAIEMSRKKSAGTQASEAERREASRSKTRRVLYREIPQEQRKEKLF
jgi:hypothetical protein